MRLIRCRKCGASIATDEAFIQRMMDNITELSEMARKDRKNAPSYLSQAAAIKKIMNQYLHATTDLNDQRRRLSNELSVIKLYIRENNLIPDNVLAELQEKGRRRAAEKAAQEEERISQLYGAFDNISINRTRNDPTAAAAERNLRKGR